MVKAFAGASLVVALSVSMSMAQKPPAAPAAPAAPVVKDQGEYDALTAAQNEKDLVKKADLLKVWADKYPDSQFKNQRMLMMIQTWTQIAAKTMQSTPTPDALAQGKAAAQSLVDNMDTAFSPAVKPANVTDDQWAAARKQVEETAHMVLAFVAQQAKDYPTAEAEYKKVLGIDDQNAQASYQLGATIVSEKKTERTPEALYEFARALSISGPMALGAPEPKKTIDAYLKRAWDGYHGNDDPKGLDDLKALAAKSALPPADIDTTIKSVVDREKEKFANEEDFLKAHPDIKLWRDLKATLTAADGDDYFTKSMKGAIVPQQFNAKVVSWTPDTNPSEITISIDDPKGDAVIKYEKPIKTTLVAGQAITIKGYAESFTKDPFSLTFKGEESEITGITIEKPPVKKPVRRRTASQ
jgi:tetratricopeptide (TPR) repeat protein